MDLAPHDNARIIITRLTSCETVQIILSQNDSKTGAKQITFYIVGKELIDENDFLKFVKQIQDLCPLRTPNEDEESDLLAAFQVFDMDNDGFITKDELRIAMEMIGEEISEEQLTHVMQMADTDKDGKINYKGLVDNPS